MKENKKPDWVEEYFSHPRPIKFAAPGCNPDTLGTFQVAVIVIVLSALVQLLLSFL